MWTVGGGEYGTKFHQPLTNLASIGATGISCRPDMPGPGAAAALFTLPHPGSVQVSIHRQTVYLLKSFENMSNVIKFGNTFHCPPPTGSDCPVSAGRGVFQCGPVFGMMRSPVWLVALLAGRGLAGPGCGEGQASRGGRVEVRWCWDPSQGFRCQQEVLSCCPGHAGPACQPVERPASCPGGRWGRGCSLRCFCQRGGLCRAQDGVCSCPPAYTGPLCEREEQGQGREAGPAGESEVSPAPPSLPTSLYLLLVCLGSCLLLAGCLVTGYYRAKLNRLQDDPTPDLATVH